MISTPILTCRRDFERIDVFNLDQLTLSHEAIKYCLPFLSVLFTNNSSMTLSVFIGPYVIMLFIDIWWSYKLPYWSSLAIAMDIVILSFSSKKDETLCQKKKTF